jgi:hypothetical protein
MATPSGVGRRITRTAWVTAMALWLMPAGVFGQGTPMYPIPIEASVGVGMVRDQSPGQSSPALMGSLSWDYSEKWWAVPVLEGEFGPTSDVGACQSAAVGSLENCADAALLVGFRLRPAPNAWSGVRPFASVMVGGYWKGSDANDQDYSSSHPAMQVGGGLEIRWPNSIQGVRLSVDYRHVFAAERSRNQLRVLASYVIGPRRFVRRPPA